MSDRFIMSARQAAELDFGLERHGWTPADVKALASGDMLARLLPVLRGLATVSVVTHRIDLDANPIIPAGITLETHTKGGMFEWNPAAVALYLAEGQKNGNVVKGSALQKDIADQAPFNACLHDYLYAHPELIPEAWKKVGAVFFWGTIFRDADGFALVRYLFWDGQRWYSNTSWLEGGGDDRGPAAVRASQT